MTKLQFMMSLQDRLTGLPRDEQEQRLEFYSEMIDDRIEEGMTEAEAVAAIGSVEDIVAQIIAETPLVKIAKEKMRPKRRLKTWEILLLALGCPLWLPLLAAAGAVILAVYASAWSVIVSVWAAFGALIAGAVAGLVAGIALACISYVPFGMVMLAAGMVCAGISILMFYGCKVATKGILILTKKFAVWLKSRWMKKEAAL